LYPDYSTDFQFLFTGITGALQDEKDRFSDRLELHYIATSDKNWQHFGGGINLRAKETCFLKETEKAG